MTSFERVFAAIEGRPQPRPPFTLTLSLYGAKLTGCPLEEYYRDPVRYAAGQEAVAELVTPDILFAPFALSLEGAAFGSALHFHQENPPTLKKPVAPSPEEFFRLSLPDLNSNPHLLYLRESVKILAGRFKGSVPVCAIVTAPVDLPVLIMGIDSWIDTLISRPGEAQAILALTTTHFVTLANSLLAEGASFVALPMIFTNPAFLYRKLIIEMILPAMEAAFRQVKGPIVFHHGGSRLVPSLADYLALPNVAGFALDPHDSFVEARSILGPGRLLLGNLNGPTLAAGTDAAVIERVNAILDECCRDPHTLFATSGADVPWKTPPERLQMIAGMIRARETRS